MCFEVICIKQFLSHSISRNHTNKTKCLGVLYPWLGEIEWLDKCLLQMILKHIDISLTNKVSYFMDTPRQVQVFSVQVFSVITEMQCIFFLMFQHAESAKMPLVTLLKKLLADNGIFKMPDVHMLGYH